MNMLIKYSTIKNKALRVFLKLLILFIPKKKNRQLKLDLGICSLLCHVDVDMFIFSLKSLFYFIGMDLPIYITDDGSLTLKDKIKIKKYFQVEIMSRIASDKKMAKLLEKYRFFKKIRLSESSAIYKYKIDSLFLSKFKRKILIDPDIIFQKSPIEMINWIKNKDNRIFYTVHDDKFFQKGYFEEYSFRVLLFKFLKLQMSGGFSSGLVMFPEVNKEMMDNIDLASKMLINIYRQNSDNIDEVLLSILIAGSDNPHELPVSDYYVIALEGQYNEEKEQKASIIHYGHLTNYRYYKKALEVALKNKFFTL